MKAEIDVNVNTFDVTRKAHQYHVIDLKQPRDQYEGQAQHDLLADDLDLSRRIDNNSFIIQDDGAREILPRNYVTLIHIPQAPDTHESYSCQLLPYRYSERLYVTPRPKEPQRFYTSHCVYDTTPEHFKQTMQASKSSQTPVNFKECFVVQRDTTRRRFKMTLDCEPRIRPRSFGETLWVKPKKPQIKYESRLESSKRAQTRFKSSVYLLPISFCNNFIEDFEFLDDSEEDWTDASDVDDQDLEWDDSTLVRVDQNGGRNHQNVTIASNGSLNKITLID